MVGRSRMASRMAGTSKIAGRSWTIVTYLSSLYPGIPRWDDSHNVYIYACRGRSCRQVLEGGENVMLIEQAS